MTQSLRMAHLVVGGIAVVAFLITGQIMGRHEPPVAAIAGSLLALAGAVLTFFAFFAEPMAHRPPGMISSLGLFVLFGGVLLYTLVSLGRSGRNTA